MEQWLLYGGMALCLFSLWAIARYDWVRLTRPSRRVIAQVIGHYTSTDGDGTSYAAIYRFSADGGTREVRDIVLESRPRPPIGELRELSYPEGRPDLARPRRPLLWLGLYLVLIAMLGTLGAKAAGLLPD